MIQREAIVITGASSGIGAAFARALAGPGRTLALLGRDAGRLEEVAAACRAKGAACKIASIDVCDHEAMAAFFDALERVHGIDLLIANAGIMRGRPHDSAVESGTQALALLRTNVHLALPGMQRRCHGEIVLMGSLSSLSPLPDAPAYSASKAALLSYGLALREAVRAQGIKVVVGLPRLCDHTASRPAPRRAAGRSLRRPCRQPSPGRPRPQSRDDRLSLRPVLLEPDLAAGARGAAARRDAILPLPHGELRRILINRAGWDLLNVHSARDGPKCLRALVASALCQQETARLSEGICPGAPIQ